jgi:ABC-type multidrug transport system ATPase subunit
MRILAAIMDPTGGNATIAGFDLRKQAEEIKAHIGYMAQQFALYGDLSVLENINFFADVFGVRGKVRRERIERLLNFARLTEFTHRPAGRLSGGMKKKLGLACALIHAPDILYLDEPTTGVDPVSRREFWDILAGLHADQTTILVNTPYMDEAERCSRVGLMYEGRLIEQGTPNQIKALIPGKLVEFKPESTQFHGVGLLRRANRILSQQPGVLDVAIAFEPGSCAIGSATAALLFSNERSAYSDAPSSSRATSRNCTRSPCAPFFTTMAPNSSSVARRPFVLINNSVSTGREVGCWPTEPAATWTFCSRIAATTSEAVRPLAATLFGSSHTRIA